MVGATVETWLVAVSPVLLVAGLGILGWVLRQIVALGRVIVQVQQQLVMADRERAQIRREFDERLVRLEAWQDGFRVGQANGHG